jgi:hypothetical protein
MKSKRCFKDNQSFCGNVRLSRHTYALHPRRVWASSDDLHLRVSVGNSALIGLNLPLTALVGIVGRRKIITFIQINKNSKSKSLSGYTQQRLIRRDPKATNSRHTQTSSESLDSSLLAPTTNHF